MTKFSILTILLTLGLGASPGWGDSPYPFSFSPQGTWTAQFTLTSAPPGIPAGYQFPVLLSFHSDGTMIATDNEAGDGPAGLGVWGVSGREFIFTFSDFQSDAATGAASGTALVRGKLALDSSGQWSGNWQVDIADLNGKPVLVITGTLKAKRLQLQAPPA